MNMLNKMKSKCDVSKSPSLELIGKVTMGKPSFNFERTCFPDLDTLVKKGETELIVSERKLEKLHQKYSLLDHDQIGVDANDEYERFMVNLKLKRENKNYNNFGEFVKYVKSCLKEAECSSPIKKFIEKFIVRAAEECVSMWITDLNVVLECVVRKVCLLKRILRNHLILACDQSELRNEMVDIKTTKANWVNYLKEVRENGLNVPAIVPQVVPQVVVQVVELPLKEDTKGSELMMEAGVVNEMNVALITRSLNKTLTRSRMRKMEDEAFNL